MPYKEQNKAVRKTGKGAYSVNLKKVESDDSMAYSYGYVEGKEGKNISDSKNLSKAYKEGWEKGNKEYKETFQVPEEMKLIGHEKDYDIYETRDGRLFCYNGDSEEDFKNPVYWEEMNDRQREIINEVYEIQTNQTPAESIQYLKDKDVAISRHDWSFETKKDNSISLTLGNLSDAGWFWSGDQKDIIGFTYRLHQSKVENEFYAEMNNNRLSFNQLKPLYYESAEKGNSLYEVSGDNVRWKFGEGNDVDYLTLEEEGLTDRQKEKFYEQYSPITYEEFSKKYNKKYQADVQKAIKSSGSFREFNIKMDELKVKYSGLVDEENKQKVELLAGQIKGQKLIE